MLHQAIEADMRLQREQKLQKITAYVDDLNPDQLREELIETLMKLEELTSPETDVFTMRMTTKMTGMMKRMDTFSSEITIFD